MAYDLTQKLDALDTDDVTTANWLEFMSEYHKLFALNKKTKDFAKVLDRFADGLKISGIDSNMEQALCLILDMYSETDKDAFQPITNALYTLDEDVALFTIPTIVKNSKYAATYFRLCPADDYIKAMYEPWGSLVREHAIVEWVETFPYFLERFDDSYFVDDFSEYLSKPMLFSGVCFKLMEHMANGNKLQTSTIHAVSYMCAVHCIEAMHPGDDNRYIFDSQNYIDMLKSCDTYVRAICGDKMLSNAMRIIDVYKSLGQMPRYSQWHHLTRLKTKSS